jgi:hypothetical protein
MNLADWLRTLGLGQYEAAFRENSVTFDLLPNLTPEDLKDLGIRLSVIVAGCWMPSPLCAPTWTSPKIRGRP